MENDPPDIVFPYTEGEFFSLQQANIAASSISLVASICVVLTYIYMLVYHGKKANRVSLRCVFLCSVSEALSSIMSIVVTTDKVYFCNAANIVIGFTSIFSSAALTIVGINLILIFVINVKRRDVLERFYYPILVIYSIVGALAPIYRHIGVNSTNTGDHSCWYITYILVRSKSNFPYIWFYVFVFFSNIVALICSLIAMIKLFNEQRRMKTVLKSMAKTSTFSSQNTNANQQPSQPIKINQSGILKKVVLRCAIYPLVPFISDIFGFIMELMINNGINPSFAIAMLDVFFSRIEGFLVALVFFSDPAVTSMIVEGYRSFYQKYVVEYTTVTKEEMESIMKECRHIGTSPTFLPSPAAHHPEIFNIESNYKLCKKTSSSAVSTREGDQSVQLQDRICENEKTHNQQTIKETPKMIPVRKIELCVPEKRKEAKHKRLSFYSTSSQSSNEESGKREGVQNMGRNKLFFVPYRYPHFAKIIHRLMCISKPENHRGVSGGGGKSSAHAHVESTLFEEASSLEDNSHRESTLCQSKSSLLISKY